MKFFVWQFDSFAAFAASNRKLQRDRIKKAGRARSHARRSLQNMEALLMRAILRNIQ